MEARNRTIDYMLVQRREIYCEHVIARRIIYLVWCLYPIEEQNLALGLLGLDLVYALQINLSCRDRCGFPMRI